MAEAEPQLLCQARLFADTRAGLLEKGSEVLQALRADLIQNPPTCAPNWLNWLNWCRPQRLQPDTAQSRTSPFLNR